MMARLFIGGEFLEADKVEPVIEAATGEIHPSWRRGRGNGRSSTRSPGLRGPDHQMDITAPFGGVKANGIGRELGPEWLAAYQTLKSIYRVGASN
jgi:hypothetical protein